MVKAEFAGDLKKGDGDAAKGEGDAEPCPLRERCRSTGRKFWVTRVIGATAGCIGARASPRPDWLQIPAGTGTDGPVVRTFEIGRLLVDPKHRRQGIRSVFLVKEEALIAERVSADEGIAGKICGSLLLVTTILPAPHRLIPAPKGKKLPPQCWWQYTSVLHLEKRAISSLEMYLVQIT
mmetsp:Transcript_3272/g.6043  ORF Transcript_3272/g.6043 Transcript_3272/m.6043 type:complete len:179 (-) Transcript_3272:32-568(-)